MSQYALQQRYFFIYQWLSGRVQLISLAIKVGRYESGTYCLILDFRSFLMIPTLHQIVLGDRSPNIYSDENHSTAGIL